MYGQSILIVTMAIEKLIDYYSINKKTPEHDLNQFLALINFY